MFYEHIVLLFLHTCLVTGNILLMMLSLYICWTVSTRLTMGVRRIDTVRSSVLHGQAMLWKTYAFPGVLLHVTPYFERHAHSLAIVYSISAPSLLAWLAAC